MRRPAPIAAFAHTAADPSATTPHSGHRSGVARKSYPHFRHRPPIRASRRPSFTQSITHNPTPPTATTTGHPTPTRTSANLPSTGAPGGRPAVMFHR